MGISRRLDTPWKRLAFIAFVVSLSFTVVLSVGATYHVCCQAVYIYPPGYNPYVSILKSSKSKSTTPAPPTEQLDYDAAARSLMADMQVTYGETLDYDDWTILISSWGIVGLFFMLSLGYGLTQRLYNSSVGRLLSWVIMRDR